MPIATPKQFAAMLDAAQKGSYAYPAINCTSIVTLNAAFKAFADMKSDGIIQFSTGAGQFASGLNNKDATKGTIILAEVAHRLAEVIEHNLLPLSAQDLLSVLLPPPVLAGKLHGHFVEFVGVGHGLLAT